jgi:hypothetical protein
MISVNAHSTTKAVNPNHNGSIKKHTCAFVFPRVFLDPISVDRKLMKIFLNCSPNMAIHYLTISIVELHEKI